MNTLLCCGLAGAGMTLEGMAQEQQAPEIQTESNFSMPGMPMPQHFSPNQYLDAVRAQRQEILKTRRREAAERLNRKPQNWPEAQIEAAIKERRERRRAIDEKNARMRGQMQLEHYPYAYPNAPSPYWWENPWMNFSAQPTLQK